jgi:hypothetical protein
MMMLHDAWNSRANPKNEIDAGADVLCRLSFDKSSDLTQCFG